VRTAGIAAAGLALVTVFVVLGFPYDRLAQYIEAEVHRETGVTLVIGAIEPRLGLAGPALLATGLRLRWPRGDVLPLDAIRVRPAWSLSWLQGAPALRVRLGSPMGEADGTYTLDGFGAWNGEFRAVDLAALPIDALGAGAELEGAADAFLDLRIGEPGPEGRMTFEASDGSVAVPNFPIALPYDRLHGEIEFGGSAFATVKSLELEGPLLSAEVRGSVHRAPVASNAPIEFNIVLRAQPGVRPLLESTGLRVSRDGTARVTVGGTLAHPVPR
jgi:type II secretion system protein N